MIPVDKPAGGGMGQLGRRTCVRQAQSDLGGTTSTYKSRAYGGGQNDADRSVSVAQHAWAASHPFPLGRTDELVHWRLPTPEQPMTSGHVDPIAQAASLGIVDAFVFRRVSASQWVHLGGLGRGRGWAGLVDVDETSEPILASLPRSPGAVVLFDHQAIRRVLGPYYGVSGAVVRASNDVFVLLGHPSDSLVSGVSEAHLLDLALRLEEELEEIRPSKRLGDELEILHAVRAATTGPATDLLGTLTHLLGVAMESLSCEVGLVRDGAGNVVTLGLAQGSDMRTSSVASILDELQHLADPDSWCVQDTGLHPLASPLGADQGVCAVLTLAIPPPVGGVLVVAHTTSSPRGFTSLCQELGRQVATAAGVVAHTAGLREELRAVADEQSRTARRDALTGLGNRLSWDEALAAFQDRTDSGASGTLVTIDVDGLKALNDSRGHAVGDELLMSCAEILRTHTRDEDVCVRLGGDEFALLLPFTGALAVARVRSLSDALAGVTSCENVVVASVGAATVHCGGSVADAVRDADAAMYAAKRARRVSAAVSAR